MRYSSCTPESWKGRNIVGVINAGSVHYPFLCNLRCFGILVRLVGFTKWWKIMKIGVWGGCLVLFLLSVLFGGVVLERVTIGRGR